MVLALFKRQHSETYVLNVAGIGLVSLLESGGCRVSSQASHPAISSENVWRIAVVMKTRDKNHTKNCCFCVRKVHDSYLANCKSP